MTNISPPLIAALAWITVSAPVAAESSRDIVANPSSATLQAETSVNENIAADAPVSCEYGCEEHREGTEICINKKQHRCGKLGWNPTGLLCANPPPVAR